MVVLRPATSEDHPWVVSRHGQLYLQEYAWDASFESLVAGILADHAHQHGPDREAGWIAELGGQPVGCVFCMKRDEDVAQLRLLLVEPHARGKGIGDRLVKQGIAFAREKGYTRMMLWTNDVLLDARRIYERNGFRLVEKDAHHSFGHDLVGQNWWLEL